MNYDYLSVSNGSGDAALMHVESDRLVGSTTIDVDSVTNVPTKFIATTGTIGSSGFIDPTTKTDFWGHIAGGDIIIDGFCPGSSDTGNTEGQVVVIKPNTYWADTLATHVMNITGNGTPEAATVAALTAAAISATSLATTGNATIGGDIAITGTSRVVPGSVTTADGSNNITPTKQMFTVSALAAAATILAPTFSVQDMMSGVLRIKDNGTARALTWNSAWVGIGVSLPSTTTAGKWMYISYIYSSTDTKYHVLGVARQS